MKLTKKIYSIESDTVFSVLNKGRKQFFYATKYIQKTFWKYIFEGNTISFSATDKPKKVHGLKAYKVTNVTSIYGPKRKKIREFFSFETIKSGIKDLILKDQNNLFLDFEMNMQDYVSIDGFFQEIIEVGYYLTNSSGNIIAVDHFYVKPTLFPELTKRTMRFLKYPDNVLDGAKSFSEFYQIMQDIIGKYNPRFFVWGKTDIKTMRASFDINKLRPLSCVFVDLLQLHTTYYEYQEQPGLFKMWEAYYGKELPKQAHNALEDAKILYEIFYGFKKHLEG